MLENYDVHTHVVPPGLPLLSKQADRDSRWAQLRVPDQDSLTGDVIVNNKVFRTVRRVAFDLDARVQEMQESGTRGQVLSAMPELFATWAPPDLASEYCTLFNQWLAAEVQRFPDQFVGLGLVPVQAPSQMAEQLYEVAGLGLAGVEIPSTGPTAPIYAREYEQFFAAAEELGMLVFIHSVGDVDAFANGVVGSGAVFPARIGEAVAGLIANGVMERHPALKLLISHGGGGMAASLARLEFIRGMAPVMNEILPLKAHEYARRMWFDHLVFDPDLLAGLIATVGEDRVLFGSDYPFLRGDIESLLSESPLPPHTERTIRVDNPQTFLTELTGC